MTTDQLLLMFGVIVAAIAAYAPLRYSIHKDSAERARLQADDRRQAILDATGPLIDERNYWRERADELEKELREHQTRRPQP